MKTKRVKSYNIEGYGMPDSVIDEAFRLLAKGHSVAEVAEMVRVTPSTVYKWRARQDEFILASLRELGYPSSQP